MKIDAVLRATSLREVADAAPRQEKAGYDGLWAAEMDHDPFLSLAVAALETEHVALGTSIAVALARNPMSLAMVGNDLQLASEGRFYLGLGTQIKAHIEKRFSMPWSQPAKRMREMILAMRAIWSAWNEGTPLNFRGDFYTHTLMTPTFAPEPNPFGAPKVVLAAVGERMTEVAGEVADGILVHGFTTPRYLYEVTVPAIERGLALAGRSLDDFEICYPCFVVTGASPEAMAAAAAKARQTIAFYGSTPAYRAVLELHGWGDLQTELNTLSKSDRSNKWLEMGGLITDDVLHAFAVVAEPDGVVAEIGKRLAGTVDRLNPYSFGDPEDPVWTHVVGELKAQHGLPLAG